MRCANKAQMRRLSSTAQDDQAAISSKVRQQPSHSCDALDMRQTDTQGDKTSCAVAMACAFLSKRCAAGEKRSDSDIGGSTKI